jgi:L,D-peptidoglycan transpeptidase YkuD (ErfK/YbiS/YcfS/YnhG family)
MFVVVLVLLVAMAIIVRPLPAAGEKGVLMEDGRTRESNEFELLRTYEREIGASSQVLLVRRENLSTHRATLYAFEKQDRRWHMAFAPIKAVVGRNGFAPPGEKREGDGRTPSGVFSLNLVFGYQERLRTRMNYRMATKDDIWVDDAGAPDYNRWVKRGETRAASYEEMRRDDGLYRYGIVIEYNTNPVVRGHGSAIFVHVWRGEDSATAGCVALADGEIVRLIEWLDPQRRPLIVLGARDAGRP